MASFVHQLAQLEQERMAGRPFVNEPEERKAGEIVTLDVNGVKVDFRWAPAGKFPMGSPMTEVKLDPETQKRKMAERDLEFIVTETLHEVELTNGFWIAETPTTQELWKAVTGKKTYYFKRHNQLPVVNVSWDDCQKFVDLLNSRFHDSLPCGYKFALPTEAQWEYACQYGSSTAIPFDFASTWLGDGKSMLRAYDNVLGLCDLPGNHFEWCADWFNERYYQTPPQEPDSIGPPSGSQRVMHGGYRLIAAPSDVRAKERCGEKPRYRGAYCGFRLVLVRQ